MIFVTGYGGQAGQTHGQQMKGIGMIHVPSLPHIHTRIEQQHWPKTMLCVWQTTVHKLVDMVDKELKAMVF